MAEPRWSQDAYKRALDFAASAHGDQRVPGSGAPYVVHLTKVAMETMAAVVDDVSLDADLGIACALLHDSVEDAGVTPAQLEAEFGAAVAAGVVGLTKNDALPKEQRMADSLARLRLLPREVQLVKLADRITNLEPPPPKWSVEKRRGYREEARAILAALTGSSPLLEQRIAAKIEAYVAYCV
ncbi:MAG: HD domain-containing protein [Deltaproteobacteria bacterium]|nr:HD domain-containing protein [Deltaproteobacteria bacterium]